MKHYKIKPSITDRSSISVDLYLKDISKFPILTPEEELNLVTQMRNGDKVAREKLINSNLRFVVSIAKQYQNKGLDFADLISVGNLGLMTAIDRFNPEYNCRILSYAIWWIRDFILQELFTNGKTIKVPVGKVTAVNKLNRVLTEFEQKNERPPTVEELVPLLGMSNFEIEDLLSYSQLQVFSEETVSDDGDTASLYDSICDEDSDADSTLKNLGLTSVIEDILSEVLNPIEYQVIIKLFGIGCGEMAYNDIAEDLNLTKERVRQIKDKAIIKLRKSNKINFLQKYL